MAQFMSRDEPRLPRGGFIVADLLGRNTPTRHAPDTAAISVGSLLRREGRAPHCVDRPILPRAHHQRVAEPDSGPRISGTVVRRAAVVAGTLLTAGSVFGAAMLTDLFAGADAPQAREGSTPGRGVLGGYPATDGVIPGSQPGNDTVIAGFRGDDVGAPIAGAVGTATPDLSPTTSTDPAPGRAGPLATVASSGREPVGEATNVVGSAAPEPLGTPMRSPSGTGDSGAEPATEPLDGDETDREAQQPALSGLDHSDDDPKPDGLLHSVGRTAAGLLGN